MQDSCLATALQPVINVLLARGIDADALLLAAGIPPALVRQPDARIPLADAERFWAQAKPLAGDAALDIALALRPAMLHAVGFAWLASETLEDAFARLLRYRDSIDTARMLELHRTEGLAWVSLRLVDGEADQAMLEARLAAALVMCRAIAGESLNPEHAYLRRPAPANPEKIRAFYRCPVVFGASRWAFALPEAAFLARLPTANAEMARSAEEIAAAYLARHDKQDVVARVRQAMVVLLPTGECSRARVARELAMSERTLQRRLAEAGASFAGLLDSLREALAEDYLRVSHHSIYEVSWLLGFSEMASFSRAFRRWKGVSPSEWRESISAA
jgi:AraC-like DNA-binding protein